MDKVMLKSACITRLLNPSLGLIVLFSLLAGCVTETNDPMLSNADPERFVKMSIGAATEYIKEGNTEAALRHLDGALKKDSNSAEAHNALALVYRLTGDKALEEKHYKLAIRYDPKFSQARNNYGTFLYNQGRYKDALYQLERASQDPLYEKRAVALENMGRCYLKLGDKNQAEAVFLEAIRKDERMARSYLELADLAYREQDMNKTADYIEQFSALSRHTPRSLWLGIQAQRVVGNQNALASYELALRNLYPQSAEYKAFLRSQ